MMAFTKITRHDSKNDQGRARHWIYNMAIDVLLCLMGDDTGILDMLYNFSIGFTFSSR